MEPRWIIGHLHRWWHSLYHLLRLEAHQMAHERAFGPVYDRETLFCADCGKVFARKWRRSRRYGGPS